MPQLVLARRFRPALAALPREAGAKSGAGQFMAIRPLQRLRRLQPRQQARHKRCQGKRNN